LPGYYQPLTMISLMLDVAMGARPDDLRAFHRTSLILHLVNTALVIILLYQLLGSVWMAAVGGALFGLHPVAVDRITWIADRKTVLSTCFALAALVSYVRYTRSRRWGAYGACLGLFVLGLLAKPAVVVLPILMLLLDWWPLLRISMRAIAEKAPHLVCALASIIITAISESRTTQGVPAPPVEWLLVLAHNTAFYLATVAWPKDLTLWDPFPASLSLSDRWTLVGTIAAPILIALMIVSLRWTPVLMVGGLFFFIGWLPSVGGVLRVRDIIAADRFIYFPMIGLLLVVTYGLQILWTRLSRSHASPVPGIVMLAAIAGVLAAQAAWTRRAIAQWSDSVTLHRYVLAHAPNSAKAEVGLAGALLAAGAVNEAIPHYQRAVAIGPADAETHANLGSALGMSNQPERAASQLRRALELNPDYAPAHYNLANALSTLGRRDEAIAHYRRSLELAPDNADAHNNLGIELLMGKNVKEAIEHFRTAVELRPEHPSAARNLELAREFQNASQPRP
jgi:Tfp pilus assembly protein PilF